MGSMTPLGFGIVRYIMYNKTKPLTSTIAFWAVVSPRS